MHQIAIQVIAIKRRFALGARIRSAAMRRELSAIEYPRRHAFAASTQRSGGA
jgi:hypothetical protein